jgi:hypothetical protein
MRIYPNVPEGVGTASAFLNQSLRLFNLFGHVGEFQIAVGLGGELALNDEFS